MKRAVNATLASRLYSGYSWEILTSISENAKYATNPYFLEQESKDGIKKILVVLITSNRGLCGSYNAQAIKKSITLLKQLEEEGADIDFLPIGKKGLTSISRLKKSFKVAFNELPDTLSMRDISPISKLILDEYNNKNYQEVFIVYTDFISALTQAPKIKQILPIKKETLKEFIDSVGENKESDLKNDTKKIDYLFEGKFDILLDTLANKIIQMQVYQMILESNASEQSARMMAMKNASDASGEMIDDLTLAFNKARQANITREISEISAGMASVT
jgi:F-type H+-transporting ATPase subunit gamma